MTAAVLVAHGGPEALEVRHDVPVPAPAAGHVRVEVAAAGINNTDLWTRQGASRHPRRPGRPTDRRRAGLRAGRRLRGALLRAPQLVDVVGGPTFGALLGALGTGGRIVTCGAVAGPVVEVDLRVLYLQRRRLIGSTMHSPSQFRRLVQDARAGRLEPPVAGTYPLAEIHRAQEDFAAGDHVGKLVLTPGR